MLFAAGAVHDLIFTNVGWMSVPIKPLPAFFLPGTPSERSNFYLSQRLNYYYSGWANNHPVSL
jgi:hypothetical protein